MVLQEEIGRETREAIFAIKREMNRNSKLEVTIPFSADDEND